MVSLSYPVVLRSLITTIGMAMAFTVLANAQFGTGTIAGSVTDPTGAFIANATVTISNVGTSVRKTLQADSSGNFVASAMPSGTYVVSAVASNFSETQTQTITLNVGATVHVNLALSVAGTQQVVEVTGTNTSVDTDTTATRTTLNQNQIANLPINGRDV